MTRRLKVDPDLCQGTGQCVQLAAGSITFDSIGVAQVVGDGCVDDDTARRLIAICPSMAISESAE